MPIVTYAAVQIEFIAYRADLSVGWIVRFAQNLKCNTI